ncbi:MULTISPECIES: PorP/SprF family type IX secretion system membrane protein [unclassified Saccharicrinis]|uniref:PorP/SprF family type IX secretion system membrane protein n=1 Tax=unclassified Saccharicrinis TaxID=2646859 RepID=UPI003D33AF4C
MYLLKDNIFKCLVLIVFFSIHSDGLAQLFPVSNQYLHNAIAINPAETGNDGALSASLVYWNQWVGFEGAPKTLTAAVHAPFNKDRIGLGLVVISDSYGIAQSNTIRGNYAFRTQLGRGNLSFGLSVSAQINSFSVDELYAGEHDDDILYDYPENSTKPNFGTGIYYASRNYFLGLAVPNLLSNGWESDGSTNTVDTENYSYYGYGGFQLKLHHHIKFAPSALLKYYNGREFQVDITPNLIIMDRIWAGINYRSEGMMSGLLRCNVDDQLSLAYSYDFELGERQKYTGASHELMLKYVFKYKSKVMSPR